MGFYMSNKTASQSIFIKDENRIFASNPLVNPKFLILVALGIIAFIVYAVKHDFEIHELQPLQEQHLLAQMKPEMEIKANQGKEAAILWMAKNFPNEKSNAQLDQLVLKNNPEALFLKYRQLHHFWNTSEQNEKAIPYLIRAASEGHPQAVEILRNDKTPLNLSSKEYFSRLKDFIS